MNVPNYHFLEVPNNLISSITDKAKSSKSYFKYLLSRTQMMFKYTNLPETIDPMLLERMLQVNGVACITEATVDGQPNLYAFSGSVGGELDVYYRPTKFVVSNPHLTKDGFSKEVIINGSEEHTGVLMYNDSEWQGLTNIISRYASLMTENVLTTRIADIMLRKMDIIISGTDKAKKSADLFLKQLEDGKLASLADSTFFESIRTLPVSNYNGSYLIQFIELQQYLKGSFYNELGLRANYNMKREAIGEGESTLDADSVLPLCENMLNSRRTCIALVNQLFDTDISVDYNSAWLENHIDSYLSIYNKIAESVNTMHAQEQPQLGVPTAMPAQGENNDTGNTSADPAQPTVSQQAVPTDDVGQPSISSSSAAPVDAGQSTSEGEPGEERYDTNSGVGRELEGTGQDEELIELEEVVEKLIDNVYEDVVGQPNESSSLGGESGASDEMGSDISQGQLGGNSWASDEQSEDELNEKGDDKDD